MKATGRTSRAARLGMLAALWALPACGKGGDEGASAVPAAAVKAPAKPQRVVVVRPPGAAGQDLPTDADIKDGLSQAGLKDGVHYELVDRAAGPGRGGLDTVASAASGDGTALLVTLDGATAVAAAGMPGRPPLAFFLAGDPVRAGLGKSDADHPPGLTGAYLPWGGDDLWKLLRGGLPGAKAVGILFDPADPLSVAHKDALAAGAHGLTVETAEFRDAAGAVAAAKTLIGKGANALLLVTGVGDAAPAVIAEVRGAKVPVFGFTAGHARAGAVAACVPNPRWGGYEVGRRAARLLSGAAPAAVPFTRGGDFVTWTNEAACQHAGIKFPGELLRGHHRQAGGD